MTESSPPPGPRPPLSRRTKIVLGAAGALVAIPVIAIIIVLTFDWNRARPWLNAKVSEAIERPFAINGDLVVQWERPASAMAPGERTWRDYIPWPHLIANDVHVGNPPGMPAHDMASVRQFSFSLNPFALLGHTIAIPVLRFDGPSVELLRTDPAHNNWTFKRNERPSRWQLDLDRVVLAKGVLRVDDAVTRTHASAEIETLANNPTYGIGWTLRGTYNGAPVAGSGKAGAVLSLKQQTAPYPVQADLRSGATHVTVEGTVTRPAQLAALDLQLTLAGNSMARLYNFTHLVLPETPAYSTAGRLVGSIDRNSSRWTYDRFKGKVGASDIAGRLEFQTGKPRGRLSGNVVSQKVMFSDLAPLIGADDNASKRARGVDELQPAGKVLPVERFKTERWKSIDADVRYAAEHIVRKKELPVNKLSTHLTLKDGVLSLSPLDFGIAGGKLSSNIRLDGSRPGKEALKATAKVTARHIQIKQLFPGVEKIQGTTVGEINGDAQLSGVGDSVATLLASSNGEVKTLVNQGAVSKLLLEEMGLNVANIILTKMFGDKPVKLNCLAADFDDVNGVLHTRMFVVDTEEALVTIDGTINLKAEQLNLTLNPKTKGLRLFSLRSPLYVRGPFQKPDVAIDKGVLAMKLGGAVALAAAAPVAAMLPLISAGPGQDSDCARLLAQAQEKPQAPPPGKTKKR